MDWDTKRSNPFLLCLRPGNFLIKPKHFEGFFLVFLLFKTCFISHHLPWRMFSQLDIYVPWQFLPRVLNKLAEKLVCSTSKQGRDPFPSSLGPVPQQFRSIPSPSILSSLLHSILHFFFFPVCLALNQGVFSTFSSLKCLQFLSKESQKDPVWS